MASGAQSPKDVVQVDVSDLDLDRWALLDMMLEGAGLRYLLQGPSLAVSGEQVADALSIVEAVRAETSQ